MFAAESAADTIGSHAPSSNPVNHNTSPDCESGSHDNGTVKLSHSLIIAQALPPWLGKSWAATKPDGLLDWSYRYSPWRPAAPSQKRGGRDFRTHKLRSTSVTPSTQAPSRAATAYSPSPDFTGMQSPEQEELERTAPSTAKPNGAQGIQRVPQQLKSKEALTASLDFSGTQPSRCARRWDLTHKGNRSELYELLQSAVDIEHQQTGFSAYPSNVQTQDDGLLNTGISSMSASMSLQDSIQAAADALGAKARGPVSMTIRAKAVCRMNLQAATRKLMHLRSLHTQEDDSDDLMPKINPSVSLADWDASRSFTAKDLMKEQVISRALLATILDGHEEEVRPDRSTRHCRTRLEVLDNTCLGKMVKRDPERAKKHGMVLVPAWTHNKPWPPPPLRLSSFTERGNRAFQQQEVPQEQKPRSTDTNNSTVEDKMGDAKKRWRKLHNATAVGQVARSSLQDSIEAKERRRIIPLSMDEELEREVADVDIDKVIWKLADDQTAFYEQVFCKHGGCATGALRGQGLQRAMLEVGVVVKDIKQKKRLQQVQLAVIKHFRNGDDDEVPSNQGVPNPMTDRSGHAGWFLKEWVAMVAVANELNEKDQLQQDRAISKALGLELQSVRSCRESYQEYSTDGVFCIKDLVNLLADIDVKISNQELQVLLALKSLDLTIPLSLSNFIRAMKRIEDFIQALQAHEE